MLYGERVLSSVAIVYEQLVLSRTIGIRTSNLSIASLIHYPLFYGAKHTISFRKKRLKDIFQVNWQVSLRVPVSAAADVAGVGSNK